RRGGARQEPPDRRRHLCPGQSGHHGALVWRRADHRIERRGSAELAGPHSRGDARCGERRGQDLARQAPLGHRLSDQGSPGGGEDVTRHWRSLLLTAAFAIFAQPAAATTIERVVSPGGIEAWLVHEPALPLVAMNFAFVGGATEDPTDKPGVGYMVSS